MFIDWLSVQVFVRPKPTDMRKQAFGLSLIVTEELEKDPFSGSLFLFCNVRRTILKGLYWEKNGFWLLSKKLEKHRFPWPTDRQGISEITEEQLRWLFDGIDFWKAHTKLNFSSVS